MVASATGSDHHREYTVTCDTVTFASRLHDLAAPRATFFSDSMHKSVALSVQAVAMDSVSLKAFQKFLKVWRLEGVRVERKPVAWGPCIGRGQVMVLRNSIPEITLRPARPWRGSSFSYEN